MLKNSNVRGLGPLLDKIKAALERMDERFLLELGEYVSKRIVMKARMGKTMYSGKEGKLPELSARYKKARRAMKKSGSAELDPDFFSPNRSNLTLTGQYLKSIRTTKVEQAKRLVTVEPTGVRKDGMGNQQLAGYLAKMKRNVFGIDDLTKKNIKQKVLREIRKQLRNRVLRK